MPTTRATSNAAALTASSRKVGHHTRASGIVFEQSLRAQWSVFQSRRGPYIGGVDEREVLPSHDCELCKVEQPLNSGSATVPRDWATRRSQSCDSKMEIPAKALRHQGAAHAVALLSRNICRHPWVCGLGVLLAVCSASALPSRGHQPHHTSARKSLRDFTVSVPLAQEI